MTKDKQIKLLMEQNELLQQHSKQQDDLYCQLADVVNMHNDIMVKMEGMLRFQECVSANRKESIELLQAILEAWKTDCKEYKVWFYAMIVLLWLIVLLAYING